MRVEETKSEMVVGSAGVIADVVLKWKIVPLMELDLLASKYREASGQIQVDSIFLP